MGDDARAKVREIASEHLARGDAHSWFDVVYDRARGDAAAVPWADLLAPGGALLVVARVRDEDEAAPALPPWPLTAREIASIAGDDVALESSAPYVDGSDGVRRVRAVFRRQPRP